MNKSAIEGKVNKVDKATTELAVAGADDTTWMTPAKTKNAIDIQVPIILKSQWKTLINSTVNLPSQSSGTTTTKLYGQIQMNTIPISMILNAKKLHVEYSTSGNFYITAKSLEAHAIYLSNLWGILLNDGSFAESGSIMLNGATVGINTSSTVSLDNIKLVNEYPIYFVHTSYGNNWHALQTPYGILVSAIDKLNNNMFSNINFTMNIGVKYVGVSGGKLNLTIHYKEGL